MRPAENYTLFVREAQRLLDIAATGSTAISDLNDDHAASQMLATSAARGWDGFKSTHPSLLGVEIQTYTSSRALAALGRETFDRIRIADAADFGAMRGSLLEACRLSRDETLILVDRGERPCVADAVYAALSSGLVEPATIDGWAYNPGQLLLCRKRSADDGQRRTIAVGITGARARAEWELTGPSIIAYARRIRAELFLFEEELAPEQLPLVKLIMMDRLRGCGRVLFLDVDVIVRDICPDLFAIVPVDAIALFCEGFCVDRSADIQRITAAYQLDVPSGCYANTGVMHLPETVIEHLGLSASTDPIYLGPVNEQDHLNAMLHRIGFPVLNLSALLNCMLPVTPDRQAEAFIMHFAGGDVAHNGRPICYESREPETGRRVFARGHLSSYDLRLPMIRNEIAGFGKCLDILIPPYACLTNTGLLVMHEGHIRLDCPASEDFALFGPYIDVDCGRYAIDVLFDAMSLRMVLMGGDTPAACVGNGVDETATIDVLAAYGDQLLAAPRRFAADRTATLVFEADQPIKKLECRIRSASRACSIYGLRLRSLVALDRSILDGSKQTSRCGSGYAHEAATPIADPDGSGKRA